MWDRRAFKERAKQRMNGNYWICVAVSILLAVLTGGEGALTFRRVLTTSGAGLYGNYPMGLLFSGAALVLLVSAALASGVVNLAVKLLVANPYGVGACRYYMENRRAPAHFSAVGAGFSHRFGNIVLTQFLKNLFIFLWSLLLVVPGIVKSYAYYAVPYLLAENPELDWQRALELSRDMTFGYKGKLFVTDLSFFFWLVLSGITLGLVGVFYVNPYFHATRAEQYAFLREEALRTGLTDRNELPGFGDSEGSPFPPDVDPSSY